VKLQRKRKSNGSGSRSDPSPDLNEPTPETENVVPAGLVSKMVNQLHGGGGTMDTAASDELTKKQKLQETQTNARSAAAAKDSSRRAQ